MNCKIRSIKESDIWILHKWINDPEVIRHTNTFRPISEMEQKEWFANTSYFRNNYVFGIEMIDGNKLIGTCGLYEFDAVGRKAELRMKIFETENRGKGIGTSALQQLLDFGFGDLNLNRIWLRVFSDNHAAVKLYEKGGFSGEGILRKDMFIKGQYKDVCIMGLLKNEYDKHR
jgi:diamine N-acetyltransferase